MDDHFPSLSFGDSKALDEQEDFQTADWLTRQTAAAINQLNNTLPMFPMGSKASTFLDVKIIGLLEWSLPPQWLKKFDLDGFMPTLHPDNLIKLMNLYFYK